jgi:hypothetical protein
LPVRFAVRRLEDVPPIDTGDPAEPIWHPLQHYFRVTAFGANVYVARADDSELLSTHDEAGSNQEELYLVVAGDATFTLDGERIDAPAVSVVAIPDPAVVRAATAKTAGTTVVAIGAEAQKEFRSSWQPKWFASAPQI